MKLIKQSRDIQYKSTTYEYLLKNGVRVLETVKPESTDFDISVVLKAGSFYETQLRVPQGTAHFLEHMLTRPNKKFKTQVELNNFTYGNKSRPSFYPNAGTSKRFVYHYAHGQYKAAERMIQYLASGLDYPVRDFSKYIEKERQIILGEIQRKDDPSKDTRLNFDKFFWGEDFPEFAQRVLGTEQSVNEISVDHLVKFWQQLYVANNVVIAIQSPQKLAGELKKLVQSLATIFPARPTEVKEKWGGLRAEHKYRHFRYDPAQGVFLSLNYFYELPPRDQKMDYEKDLKFLLLSDFFYKIGHDYLREQNGLIYDPSSFNERILFNFKDRGFSLSCSLENLETVFAKLDHMLSTYWREFLNSVDGKRWFAGVVSKYIFRRAKYFDSDYAEDLATEVLDGEDYAYDVRQSIKAAKKITLSEFTDFVGDFLKIPMGLWLVSPYKDEEIIPIYEKSKLYEMYKE
ncbi:insulinase family protein [Candidatus Dojkabacteria bacterium]|uniref:Insulinase family protein n=1 Tax=Candidatus Dojkabacteria bacterium TaxID=2099670 RepID=A0A955L0L6_9BACT|nr:insulinase family protein [Candidatus Dojkabacteria bacterium]